MEEYNYKLNERLMGKGWVDIPQPVPNNEFHFSDNDVVTMDHSGTYEKRDFRIMLGRPRFTISFYKQASNLKKPSFVQLQFNDGGWFEGGGCYQRRVSRKTERQWIAEALDRLCELEAIELVHIK